MIVIDTSALVDSLTGPRRSAPMLRELLVAGERILLPSIVLYEWLRGPRLPEELAVQEELFPREGVLAFGGHEAAVAAELYRRVKSPRGRTIDIAIAATALAREASLWTLNRKDFAGIPNLQLV